MKPRINLMNVNPAIIHAMLGLERQVSKGGLDNKLLNLVRMRASQINGCAYCLDMHSKDARADGGNRATALRPRRLARNSVLLGTGTRSARVD